MVDVTNLPPSVAKNIEKQAGEHGGTVTTGGRIATYRGESGTYGRGGSRTREQAISQIARENPLSQAQIDAAVKAAKASAQYKAEAQQRVQETTKAIVAQQRQAEASGATGVSLYEQMYDRNPYGGRSLAEIKALQKANQTVVPEYLAQEIRAKNLSIGQQTQPYVARQETVMPAIPEELQKGIRNQQSNVGQVTMSSAPLGAYYNIKAKSQIEQAGDFIKEVGKETAYQLGYGYRAGIEARNVLTDLGEIDRSGLKGEKLIAARRERAFEFISNPDVQGTALTLALAATAPLGLVRTATGVTQGGPLINRIIGNTARGSIAFMWGKSYVDVLENPSIQTGVSAALFSVLPLAEKAVGKVIGAGAKSLSQSFKPFTENIKSVQSAFPDYVFGGRDYTISRVATEGKSVVLPVENVQKVSYYPQLQKTPIRLESGRVIGFDLGLLEGQQKFGTVFTAPRVKTGYTESGMPIEIGRPRINIQPALKQTALNTFFPNKIVEIKSSNNIISRVKPETYAKLESLKDNLIFNPEVESKMFRENPALRGIYFSSFSDNIGYVPPRIYVRSGLTSPLRQKVIAHEIIHFKTVPTIEKILPSKFEQKLPYRLRPSEIIAFGMQKYYAKKGFKADLGKIYIAKVTRNPFVIEKLPSIPTFKITPSKQTQLGRFGIATPIAQTPKNIIALKKISKPLFLGKENVQVERTKAPSSTGQESNLVVLKKPSLATQEAKPSGKTKVRTEPSQVSLSGGAKIKGKGFFDVEYEQVNPILLSGREEDKIKSVNLIMSSSKSEITSMLSTNIRQPTIVSNAQIIIPKISQPIISIAQPKVNIKTEQDIGIRLDLKLQQDTSQIIKQRYEPKKPREQPPEVIIPKKPDDDEAKKWLLKRKMIMKKKTKAYKLFLGSGKKERQIGQALTRSEALSLGTSAALGSLAATFRIEESGFTSREDVAFKPPEQLFRNYQIRKGQRFYTPNKFIQRRGARLTTQQERGLIKAARQNARGALKSRGAKWF